MEITRQEIEDVLVTAFEGGINYWCQGVRVSDRMGEKYASHSIAKGATATLKVIDEGDDPPEPKPLTADRVREAIHQVAELKGLTVRRFLDDVPDANDADMIVQTAVFGEIIFG